MADAPRQVTLRVDTYAQAHVAAVLDHLAACKGTLTGELQALDTDLAAMTRRGQPSPTPLRGGVGRAVWRQASSATLVP